MKKAVLAAVVSAVMSVPVCAEIHFSGFGSVMAGTTSGSDESFDGFTDELELSTGSFFGLQATSDLGNGLGATVQILSKGENDWDPKFSWAYMSYDASDEWRLLFGRQRVPLYMYSDFLDVSYAYHWVAPPSAVYDANFDTFDGVGSIYATSVGDAYVTAHLIYGQNTDENQIAGADLETEFKQLAGGSLSWNYDWVTVRGAYFSTKSTIPLSSAAADTGAGALGQLLLAWQATPFTDVVDSIAVNDDSVSFAAIGVQADLGDWFAVAEYTSVTLDDMIFPDQDSWYVSVSKRVDAFVFHATVGANKDTSKDILSIYNVPEVTGTSLDVLTATTQGVLNTLDVDEPFYTLGLRWDFHDSVSLKAEYSNIEDDVADTKVNLFKVGLVSVF